MRTVRPAKLVPILVAIGGMGESTAWHAIEAVRERIVMSRRRVFIPLDAVRRAFGDQVADEAEKVSEDKQLMTGATATEVRNRVLELAGERGKKGSK